MKIDMNDVIKIKSTADQVFEYLSNAIIEGRIKPGEQLIEADLCRQLNVSRSPLRECLRMLESEGLIVIHARRGIFVETITKEMMQNAFPVRAALESLAAKLALPNITEKELIVFHDLVKRMDEAIIKKDIKAFLDFNSSFHSMFIKAAHNSILEKTIRNLGKRTWFRLAYIYYQSPMSLELSNEKHREIVKAFEQKDVLSVQRAIEDHIEHAKQELLRGFENIS